GVVTETNGSGSVTGSHTYAAAGIYTVTVTVNDNYGGSASVQFQYVVMYDPAAGYESGAGPFNSPAAAYTDNPSLAGTANLTQLSAKYGTDGTLNATTNVFKFSYTPATMTFSASSLKWL